MTTELQAVIDRLEHVERQARGWKLLVVIAILIAAASIAIPILLPMSKPATSDRARYSVVEANRILLRDADGLVAGGFEVRPDGAIRLVLGNRSTANAFLEVQRNGVGNFTLAGPDGDVRVALVATEMPSMTLSATRGVSSGVALTTSGSRGGQVAVKDATGRIRFRAP